MPKKLSDKVIDQMQRAGLPLSGANPFEPRIRMVRGEQEVEKQFPRYGPRNDIKGWVDTQGRIWIKDTKSHPSQPHWDVQLDDGHDYIRVDLNGNLFHG